MLRVKLANYFARHLNLLCLPGFVVGFLFRDEWRGGKGEEHWIGNSVRSLEAIVEAIQQRITGPDEHARFEPCGGGRAWNIN